MGVGAVGSEHALRLLGSRPDDPVRQGELEAVLVELLRGDALAHLGGDGRSADDLDGLVARPVPARHVVVHPVNGARQRRVTVLAVHVVRAAAGVVLDPDSKVLDIAIVLLRDLRGLEGGEGVERLVSGW